MKKARLLNGPISRVVALMGHTDSLCIGDAGLPIPSEAERIDLAVQRGLPTFLDVLAAITSEMSVEAVFIADQTRILQPDFHDEILRALRNLEKEQGNHIEIAYGDHEELKQKTRACRAVVRTGECTPFANIILYAGVTF